MRICWYKHTCIGKERTTVEVDENDFDIIKSAAHRLGVSEAELLPEEIHDLSLANRQWTDPIFSQTVIPVGDDNAPLNDQVAKSKKSKLAP